MQRLGNLTSLLFAHDSKWEFWVSSFYNRYSKDKRSTHNAKCRCPLPKIVDKHLGILAKKHLEAKFVKINAEKCPFLTERLRIKVIPTIMLVKDSKTRDYIVGFTDLGNHDEFSTEMMEWRIATAGVVEYRYGKKNWGLIQ